MYLKVKQTASRVKVHLISIFFIMLFILNVEIVFSNSGNDGFEILDVKVSLVKTIFGKEALPPGDGGGGGDAGNGPLDHYKMLYTKTYDCGCCGVYIQCLCYDLRCLYGGTYCVPYCDCPTEFCL